MNRQEIAALIERCRVALNRHDSGAVAAEHSEECVMDSPTAGGPVTGRVGIARVYDMWFQAFPDLTITQEDVLIDADRAAVRYTLSGTHSGGFLGLPPTGKHFHVPMVWLCQISQGKIVHSRPVYDFSGVLIQIGLLKAKPA